MDKPSNSLARQPAVQHRLSRFVGQDGYYAQLGGLSGIQVGLDQISGAVNTMLARFLKTNHQSAPFYVPGIQRQPCTALEAVPATPARLYGITLYHAGAAVLVTVSVQGVPLSLVHCAQRVVKGPPEPAVETCTE